jgi:hypothetical protein
VGAEACLSLAVVAVRSNSAVEAPVLVLVLVPGLPPVRVRALPLERGREQAPEHLRLARMQVLAPEYPVRARRLR